MTLTHHKLLICVVLAAFAVACGSGDDGKSTTPDPNGFLSDDPSGTGGPGGPGSGTGGSGGSGGSAGGGGGTAAPNDDASKAIEEADIIQLQNGRLYALSQYGGLTVINAANADSLSVLGRYRLEATPFEMYVKNGIVLAMFSSWSKYVEWQGGWQWVQTSHLVALDTTNPNNIVKLAEFELPGMISDSRMVGSALYLVSHQDGYCYGCKSAPNTTVVSLNVSVPSKPVKVDELTFNGGQDAWSWQKSISVNQNRMYVAGPEYGTSGGSEGSTIQVVDISDPTGKLVLGAKVQAAGWIQSRWQMDEYQGVLRVISQPPQWSPAMAPTVQTFTVSSAQQITPLGSMQLVLPQPESLRSARFDGPRAYAITFQQIDPLFTIDLSDPANPKQMGELEMPGWIYHMEPRGDRLLALGFDNSSTEGSLNVSLFDVSDMTAPKLVDRVNFGGDWGQFAEDQDRVHKAFTILDSLGLILVPYSAHSWSEGYYCGSSESGVQLIDFNEADLDLRGMAPGRGRARRAFVEQSRLFTVSDERVQTFDIANRDAPLKKSDLRLAHVVTHTQVSGQNVVRLGDDWWTDSATLDVVPRDRVTEPDAGISIDLAEVLGENTTGCQTLGNAELFTHDHFAYVVYGGQQYYYDYYGSGQAMPRKIATFDLASGKPVLVSKVSLPLPKLGSNYSYYWSSERAIDGGRDVVQYGSTLALHESTTEWNNYDSSTAISHSSIHVVDLANPAAPKVTSFERPSGPGHTDLLLAGSVVSSSHWEPEPGQPGKVRFYLDRIDVADGSAPKLLAKINVPGSLLSIAPGSERAITVDYQRVVEKSVTSKYCYEKWQYNGVFEPDQPYEYYDNWETVTGTCTGVHRSYKLLALQTAVSKPYATLLDSAQIEDGLWLGFAGNGADRAYLVANCYTCAANGAYDNRVEVLSGLSSGKLSRASVALPSDSYYYYYYSDAAGFQTQGTRAVFAGDWPAKLYVLDAASPSAPSLKSVHEFSSASYDINVELAGSDAICSLGTYGVEVVNIGP